jgi:hypothetical protein
MGTDTSDGKRRRGQVNGIQRLKYTIYHSAIRKTLEQDPSGLNVSKIASTLPGTLEWALKQLNLTPEQLEKVPIPAASDRKTVRKHLVDMLTLGQARLIDGLYYPIPPESSESKKLRHALHLPPEPPLSKDLIELANVTMSNVEPQNWVFPPLENAVICRTYVNRADPEESRYRFDDFFGKHIQDFKDDLFFLDQILEHAIGSGCLSPKFYKPASGSLNMRVLKDGWNCYFEDARALAWTFVINPREFLHFVETNGRRYVEEMLAANWEEIVTRGRKRRTEKRAMDRKLKRIQALTDKRASESPNTTDMQGAN